MVDFSKLFLRKTKLTKLLLVPLLLVGVSGCNNTSSTTPPNSFFTIEPVTYLGKTTPTTITPQNQAKIYAIAQGETGQLGTSVAAGSISGGSSSNLFQAINNLSNIHYTIPSQTIASGAIVQTQEQGALGGTITWTGDISSSGTGNLKAVFVNYNDGSGALNGTVNYDIRASNINTGQFYDMTATFEVLEFSSKTAHIAQSGSFSILSSNTTTTYTEAITFNQDFTDLLANFQYRYENLAFTTVFNASDPSFATQADLSISGRIYEQSEGYIDINTNPPFHFNTLTQANPSSGIIRIQGANGSLLQATAASETRTILALDTNGDGNFESTDVFAWGDEFGSPLPNNAPVISGLTLSPQLLTTAPIAVYVSATDPDGDNLIYTYEWKKNNVLIPNQSHNMLPANILSDSDSFSVLVTASDGILSHSLSTNGIAYMPLQPISAGFTTAPPVTAPNNQTLNFQVNATQPDGFPISFSILYGPDNMTVDAYGNINWTPKEPMFASKLDVNYAVRAQVRDIYTDITGSTQIIDNTRQQPFVRHGIRLPEKEKSMYVIDMNNDNQNEIILVSTSYNQKSSIAQLRFDGTNYVEDWIFPYEITPGNPIYSTAIADLNGDLKPEIIVTSKNTLAIIDGATREISNQITVSQPYLLSTEVADLDGDGNQEIITLAAVSTTYGNAFTLQVYHGSTLALIWESTQSNLGNVLTIGNVDNDAALEMITSEGFVFDGMTKALEWSYGTPFGEVIDTGDLNANGIDEIIALKAGVGLQAYSAVTKTMTQTNTNIGLVSLTLSNIDTDPYVEVIVGDGQYGNVTAYDGLSFAQQWSISTQGSGAVSLSVGDSDNDGQTEVLWASDVANSGPNQLVVAGIDPYVHVKWKSDGFSDLSTPTPHLSPSTQVQLIDAFKGGFLTATGIGQKNVTFMTPRTSNGYQDTRIISINPLTGESLLSSKLKRYENMTVVDYDKDAIDEILLAGTSIYNGYFKAYNYSTDFLEWTSSKYSNNQINQAVTNADMNNDGYEDLISISRNGTIHIWDVFAQQLLWQSSQVYNSVGDITVADLNADGNNEIIFTATTSNGEGNVFVLKKTANSYTLRGTTKVIINPHSVDTNILETGDINGDGLPEIIVGNGSYYLGSFTVAGAQKSNLFVLDGITLTEKSSFTVLGTIFDVLVSDQPSSKPSLILGIKDMNYHNKLLKVDATTGSSIWTVDKLLGTPQLNSIHLADTNGDGINELMIGTNQAMYITR